MAVVMRTYTEELPAIYRLNAIFSGNGHYRTYKVMEGRAEIVSLRRYAG